VHQAFGAVHGLGLPIEFRIGDIGFGGG